MKVGKDDPVAKIVRITYVENASLYIYSEEKVLLMVQVAYGQNTTSLTLLRKLFFSTLLGPLFRAFKFATWSKTKMRFRHFAVS